MFVLLRFFVAWSRLYLGSARVSRVGVKMLCEDLASDL